MSDGTHPTTKVCSRCKVEKPRAEFHRNRSHKTGLASRCMDCAKRIASQWVKDNPGRARKSRAEWYAVNRNHMLQKMREWREANPERKAALNRAWVERDPGRKASQDRAWRAANKEKVRLYQRVSQGRRRAATGGKRVPAAVVLEIGAMQKWKCACCRRPVKDHYEIDHIVPLSKGGKHERRNWQIMCPKCNGKKKAKDPIDFMRQQGRLL